jgi:Protein of unknown function (DUF2917)
MNLVSTPAATRLAHRGMLQLRDHAGDRIDCLDGSVWITQDGDPRDVVLDAGEAFTLDRPGTAIVYALADARVVVQRPAAASVRRSDTEPARRSLRELAAAPRSAA